ncbi:hypothetical protein KIN20_016866, partial [Parelaphostrongylus tenuis]
TYDCELEKIAFNISKMCFNVTDPNFDHVGSNIAIFHPEIQNSSDEAAIKPRYGIALEVDDMANAATTRFGCSVSICNKSSSPLVSFVCQYGKPHISVDVPIYKEGPPCNDCNDSCVFGSLCNNDDGLIYTNSMRPCSDCNMSCVDNSLCPEGLLTTCPEENYPY